MSKILLKLRKEGQTYYTSIECLTEVYKQQMIEMIKDQGYKIIRVIGD